ncbi:hypothetical protein SARC_02762 [Sphaeroforma arctica JP610]|uniref:Cation/H+ exchanger transmembrane domain-containing protein n=1 Tax=Sphaeroforma arctica JP610 TaxID=667725 RepID=A0A0L0G7M5_9EUKA|nr:hypothetical protein SARC_02762 [Sphaeroforma arctica JP610]KNC85037.1 hypothetical protein SARC_02762 [Sphaeroforma arctica JP610]|eukprot:XP_014158939.1 hypothetical protein SARC_02762 [Sphaeroforma arctica JP610]
MANETYCAAESANGTETHEEEHYTAHYAVLAVTFVVFWGILVRNIWNIPAIKKYVPLPYTVVMLIVGLIWGLIYEATGEETGDLGDLSIAFSYLVKIHPDIILYVFIPALVFESSYAINHHTFRVVFANAFLVASVGVVIVIGLTSTFCFYAFTKYEWDWLTALLLSSILAATDPVAVVALLRELGVSERLSTLIEGESLLNDGSAFVCFLLFLDQLTACPGEERNAGEFATFTLQLAVGGPLMGIAFAIMTIILLDLTFFDDIIEVSITIIAPYLCFWTCEYVEVSSVLGVVFLGLFVGRFGKAMLSSLESEEYIHRVWELISWWANTLLFVITGMVLSDRVFFNSGGVLDATDVGYLFALYAVLHVVRFISIAVLMPVLRLSGYGLNWGEVTVMTYGGLRGAIGLALALIVEDTAQVNEADRTRIMFLVGGIVGLTLLVNGSTTQFLLKVFHMGEITPERYQILDNIIDHTQEVVYESINNLQADPFFQGSDWVKVNDNLDLDNFFIERDVQADSYEEVAIDATVPMASTADGEADIEAAQHLPPASESDAGVTPMASEKQRKELRMLFLSSLKAIFTRYFYEERILNTYAYNSLMDALNREGDLDTDSLADLWEKTKGNVRQPDFLRKLRNVPGLGWAAQRATYYYISTYLQRCIAFIQAMREVRIVLEHAEGHVADPLRDEIEEITRDAHTDLVAITGWAPEAITSLQTQHSTFHILKMLLHEITEGLEEGILESSEFEAYRQLIYKRIKDLKRQRIYAPDASTDKEILEAFGGLQCFAEAYYKLNLNHHKVFIDVGESLSLKSKDKSIFIILRGVCRWTQLEYEGAPELGEITEKDEKKAAQGFEKILPSIMKNKDTDGEVIKEEEADKSSVSSPNISPPSAEHSPDMQASRNEQSVGNLEH